MRFQPGQLLDHYEIIEPIGAGAYAEVYKARDTKSGRIVMLKCPNPLLFADPRLYQRFMREAEIARRLDDPHLQQSLDLGHHRTEPYMVLEYFEGQNLRRRLHEFHGPVPIDVAIDWGKQLATVLAYLHRNGVTHRDLKPENVVITNSDKLKIVDFGSAMLQGARRLTWRHLSDSTGTPDYMSPEQIQGERGDPRSDIYAWGVMMYELLTGRVPFEGDNWLAVMAGHMQRTPTPIHDLRPDIPRALEAVVLKAMRRIPANRYATADDLVADLERLDTLDVSSFDLSPEPPLGGMAAAGSAKRLWAWMGLIALGFIAIVALIVTLTVVLR
ncbi:MAG: serine/threonine protein kinase [Actinomycetota bacterium]